MIVGIGINLYPEKISEEFSYLLEEKTLLNNEEAKRWAFELYHYISNNRLTTEEIKKNFLQHCVHLNQKIHFAVGDQRKSGLFTGIGEVGEALILDIESQQIVKLFAGSLIIS